MKLGRFESALFDWAAASISLTEATLQLGREVYHEHIKPEVIERIRDMHRFPVQSQEQGENVPGRFRP